jgi:16S rRNA (uracil1498-N3)-methyltransferase
MRIFTEHKLVLGEKFPLDKKQSHYICHVMRLGDGDTITVFNNEYGSCLCKINICKKIVHLEVVEQISLPDNIPNIRYLFTPLKQARMEYIVQKATEMGAGVIAPIITSRTIVRKVNPKRMLANAIDASQQCNINYVPKIEPIQRLDKVLDNWHENRYLIFADEKSAVSNPYDVLSKVICCKKRPYYDVLVGPEGGFTEEERKMLIKKDFVVPISLGKRIMRADTAGVAIMSFCHLVNNNWE